MHIFKSEREYPARGRQRRTNGRAASPLRPEKEPPTSPAALWEGAVAESDVGTERPPERERSEGSHL